MKTICAILLSLGTIGTCLGQGTVNWSVLNPTAITAQTNTTQFYGGGPSGFGTVGDTAPASSGMIFHYELLYNTSFTGSQIAPPDYNTLFGGTWHDTGLTATNSIIAGRLTAVNPNTAATVPWPNGVTNNILLVGWSANLGDTWLLASNTVANWNTSLSYTTDSAFFGESATGYISPGTANPGAVLFANASGPFGLPIYSPDMQLDLMPETIPTPEPSTLALAGLGGFSLLLRAASKRSKDGFRRLGASQRGEDSQRK